MNLERITDQKGQPQSQELCRNDPQMPQGFTPLKQDIAIRPGDTLKATCMFDSSNQTHPVNAGATHHDEMCNLYLMLYSQLPYFMSCYGSPQIERHGTGGIPSESSLEVPLLHAASSCCHCFFLLSLLLPAVTASLCCQSTADPLIHTCEAHTYMLLLHAVIASYTVQLLYCYEVQ